MLTMPNYFSEVMTADARRMLLLEMCGDVDDDEIITSNPELEGLKDALLIPGTPGKSYSVDEFKKIARAKKGEINKELVEIPSRIDEATRSIDPTATGTKEELADAIKALDAEIGSLELKISEVHNSGYSAASGVLDELAAARAELANVRTVYQETAGNRSVEQIHRITNIKLKLASAVAKADELKRERTRVGADHDTMNTYRADLINRYNKIAAEEFDESSTICPTCGREYPEEQIEKMREAFNLNKSRTLEAINREGKEKASKEMVHNLSARIEEIHSELATAESEVEALKSALAEAEKLPDICSTSVRTR